MPTGDSGNSEELKLKITPELDPAALKKAQDQLNALKTTTTVGGTGKGTGTSGQTNVAKQQTAALKEAVAQEKLYIDQIDLRLRKTRTAANQEIASIRERAAANKITMDQMNQQIINQQSIIDTATMQADVAYKTVATSLENLGKEYTEATNAAQILTGAEKKLFYAQGRMVHGMDSMSGSMQTIVSQTKQANLTFMNFGRIIQDAPFGLIGIANNIDPLLMSFRALSTEIDDNTKKVRGNLGAFKALGAQLMGPGGVIFLLGSVLPSALLLLQRRQKDASEETDNLAEAFKKVADEFGRLSAEAAGEKGLKNVTQELSVAEAALKNINKEIDSLNAEFRNTAEIQTKSFSSFPGAISSSLTKQIEIVDNLKEENRERVKSLENTKTLLDTQIKQLKNKNDQLEADKFIGEARKELNLAESLSLKEQIELQKELNGLRANVFELLGKDFEAEVIREQEKLKKAISDVWSSDTMGFIEKDILAKQLNQQLDKVEETVRERLRDKDKGVKKDEETRKEFELRFTKFINSELANRILNEKIALEEILSSKHITDQERLEATRRYYQNEQAIFDDASEKAKAKDEKDRQEKLKKDLDARKKFVTAQEKITELSENRIQGRYDLQIMAAELSNNKELLLELQKLQALRDLRRQYAALGLLDTEEFKKAEAAIIANIQAEADANQIDNMKLYADAVIAVGEFIFGETKGLATAQVAVDTLAGIARVLAKDPFNPANIAKAVIIAANGATTIRKINKTKKGDSSVDSSKGSTAPTTREVMIEGVGSRQGQYITPRGTVMSASAQPMMNDNLQNINIDARVDRRGLAIAVREGEREIRSSEFSYT